MKNRTLVQFVSMVVVVVFAAGIWSTGGQVHLAWLRFFSAAVFVATALLWLWDRFVWRIAAVQKLHAVPRDIGGTWKGTLESSWEGPSTSKRVPPMTAYLVVRQTASMVSVILLTAESKSFSSIAVISGAEGTATLDYMYLNQPESRVEHRSRIHHGSASLDITGRPATRLHGRYWTDRDTKGSLDFSQRSRKAVDDFREASRLFG